MSPHLTTGKDISPLRRRMIENMTLHKLSPKTQATYIHAVKNFTRFLNGIATRCSRPPCSNCYALGGGFLLHVLPSGFM